MTKITKRILRTFQKLPGDDDNRATLVSVSIFLVGTLSLLFVGFLGFVCFFLGLFTGALGIISSRKSPSG